MPYIVPLYLDHLKKGSKFSRDLKKTLYVRSENTTINIQSKRLMFLFLFILRNINLLFSITILTLIMQIDVNTNIFLRTF